MSKSTELLKKISLVYEMANANAGNILDKSYDKYRFHFWGGDHSLPRVKIFIKGQPISKGNNCTLTFNSTSNEVVINRCNLIPPKIIKAFSDLLLNNLDFISKYNNSNSEVTELDQSEIEDLLKSNKDKKVPSGWTYV